MLMDTNRSELIKIRRFMQFWVTLCPNMSIMFIIKLMYKQVFYHKHNDNATTRAYLMRRSWSDGTSLCASWYKWRCWRHVLNEKEEKIIIPSCWSKRKTFFLFRCFTFLSIIFFSRLVSNVNLIEFNALLAPPCSNNKVCVCTYSN